MLDKIEQMIADLLPVVDGEPDMTSNEPDIARFVLEPQYREKLRPLFDNRTAEEGWRKIAVILAGALIQVDRGHREIILEIRNHREATRFEGTPKVSNSAPQKKPVQDNPHGIKEL